MMLDWNDYRKQLAVGVKEVGQLSPDTIKGYVELSAAGQKKDLLGAKIRELITRERGVPLRDAPAFQSVTGKGVTGTVDGSTVALGNRALLSGLSIDTTELDRRAEELRGEGGTAMLVAIDGRAASLSSVSVVGNALRLRFVRL